MMRFYEPDAGTVRLDGRDIRTYTPESLRSVMSIVPQEPVLFEGTIADNITYGTSGVTREQMERAAQAAHCIEFVRTMPHGFDTVIGPRELSGGQRQRISLARALTTHPQILLADEPVSALDVTVRNRVIALLDELAEDYGLTMVFLSHDLDVVRHICDTVAVMKNGRIVEKGTSDQIYRDPQHEYTKELISAARQPVPPT